MESDRHGGLPPRHTRGQDALTNHRLRRLAVQLSTRGIRTHRFGLSWDNDEACLLYGGSERLSRPVQEDHGLHSIQGRVRYREGCGERKTASVPDGRRMVHLQPCAELGLAVVRLSRRRRFVRGVRTIDCLERPSNSIRLRAMLTPCGLFFPDDSFATVRTDLGMFRDVAAARRA